MTSKDKAPASGQARAGRPRGAGGKAGESDRKARLLDAALKLFSENDFASVTNKDIAGACGVNSALIYYYYKNKEGLLEAALQHAVERTLSLYHAKQGDGADPVAVIRAWCDMHAGLSQPIRQLMKITLNSSHNLQKAKLDWIIGYFYEQERSILTACIRRGVEAGTFRDVEPEEAARFLSVHLDGVMIRSLLDDQCSILQSIELVKRYFIGWLCGTEGKAPRLEPVVG